MNTSLFLFLGDIGGSELILIMVVILIFFGANKIPELARGLGKGIREFKDASSEIRSEIENAGQPRPNQYNNAPNYNNTPNYQAPPQPEYHNAPGYQTPSQPVYPAAPVEHQPYIAPETPLAPPMDGGITPPVTERTRLDQTTN